MTTDTLEALRAERDALRAAVSVYEGRVIAAEREQAAAERECDALRAEVEAVKEHDAELRGLLSEERGRVDELRAECERLRGEATEQANEKVRAIGLYGLERLKSIRLLRAAQSLHRAWRRENAFGDDAVEQWAAADSRCDTIRAFVADLRADGLDIDDPTTAPVWTGKIHVGGRLVFDLATVEDAATETTP